MSALRSGLRGVQQHGANDTDAMLQTAPTLGSGNLHDVVRLPNGEDLNEWLAVNIMDLFNQVRMLYGTITDQCTNESCPQMTAGATHEYFWTENDRMYCSADKERQIFLIRQSIQCSCSLPRQIPCSASVYIDYVMTWVQDQLDDEGVFPSQIGRAFPRNFIEVCEGIMRRLFRVYAHVYACHAARFNELNATPHLNTSFKQFILFARQFQLIPSRELEPLRSKIDEILGSS